jgi:predicted  nucleic acid-binding Zn-ribbon protein
VQALDTRLDQLAHRRHMLPEHAEIEKLDRQLADGRDLLVAAETERSDLERQRDKADADVEQVRERSRRDQQRLDTGQVGSPRELESLQSEIASLARRQSDLEDVELEILQRIEDVEARHRKLSTQQAALTAQRDAAVGRRDTMVAEIDGAVDTAEEARRSLAGQIDSALLELYEKIRAQQGGIGAAVLKHRRCSGCRLELNTVDLNRLRDAAADEVLRCEECRRILVRTDESGL